MLFVVVVFYACLVALSCEPDKRVITSLYYSNYRVQLTVVNGLPAETSRVPHLVSIKEPLAKRGRTTLWGNLCGASIISRDGKLLTAAHCFESNNFLYVKRPYILRAVHGSPKTDLISEGNISGMSKEGVQWRQIKRTVLHNNFNFPLNDIAIAFLDAPWTYSKGIVPIALDKRSADNLGECYIAGYGRTGHGPLDRMSEVLLIAKVETIPRAMCSELWGMSMNAFVCTSSRADVGDPSQGDSGGPLWCERRGQRYLAGVVSGKNFDKTTLFTRVSEYNRWIQGDGRATNNSTKFTEFSYSFPYVFLLFVLSIKLNIPTQV